MEGWMWIMNFEVRENIRRLFISRYYYNNLSTITEEKYKYLQWVWPGLWQNIKAGVSEKKTRVLDEGMNALTRVKLKEGERKLLTLKRPP